MDVVPVFQEFIDTNSIDGGNINNNNNNNNNKDMGLPILKAHQDLWYKLHVLLYDLCNVATDRAAELRMLATTDELYISAPYFSSAEAILIKQTRVIPPVLHEIPEFEYLEFKEEDRTQEDPVNDSTLSRPSNNKSTSSNPLNHTAAIEDAIKSFLKNFFEKRRASGDARPCGPHDMGPIYLAVFGIAKEELKDEKLRRQGLPRLDIEIVSRPEAKKQKTKRGEKRGAGRS